MSILHGPAKLFGNLFESLYAHRVRHFAYTMLLLAISIPVSMIGDRTVNRLYGFAAFVFLLLPYILYLLATFFSVLDESLERRRNRLR